MNKILVIGLSVFLLAACSKKQEQETPIKMFPNKEDVMTLPSASTVYNRCIKKTVEHIQYAPNDTAEDLISFCKEQAEKVKALTETLGQVN